MTLVLIGGLAAVPADSIEAARVDGASSWRVFRDITLPQLFPVVMVVVILKSIFSLKTFDQIYMLTNGGPGTATQTLAHYAYFNGFKYYDMGYAASVAWLMVIPMIFLTWAVYPLRVPDRELVTFSSEAAPQTDEACTAPRPGASLPGTSYPSQPRPFTQETTLGKLAQL